MRYMFVPVLIGLLLGNQGCSTSALWEHTNPDERIWIDANRTSESDLKKRGVDYEVYTGARGNGFLIKKSGWEKMKDYQLRALGTPVTLVVDAASVVVVVGVFIFITDPAGTVSLIDALSDGHHDHHDHHEGNKRR